MWYKKAQNHYSNMFLNTLDNEEKAVFDKLMSLRSKIAQAAQLVYDEWDPSDVDTYANGGICNLIAPEIASVVQKAFPEYIVLTALYESPNHEYAQLIIASDEEFYEESIDKDVSVFDIDIPYNIYEIHNSEYDWSKIENVTFVENDVIIEKNSYRLSDIRYD